VHQPGMRALMPWRCTFVKMLPSNGDNGICLLVPHQGCQPRDHNRMQILSHNFCWLAGTLCM
jgi:hypothetical protein